MHRFQFSFHCVNVLFMRRYARCIGTRTRQPMSINPGDRKANVP